MSDRRELHRSTLLGRPWLPLAASRGGRLLCGGAFVASMLLGCCSGANFQPQPMEVRELRLLDLVRATERAQPDSDAVWDLRGPLDDAVARCAVSPETMPEDRESIIDRVLEQRAPELLTSRRLRMLADAVRSHWQLDWSAPPPEGADLAFLFVDVEIAGTTCTALHPSSRRLLRDAWGELVRYETESERIRLVSAGPDTRLGTPDDLEVTVARTVLGG